MSGLEDISNTNEWSDDQLRVVEDPDVISGSLDSSDALIEEIRSVESATQKGQKASVQNKDETRGKVAKKGG